MFMSRDPLDRGRKKRGAPGQTMRYWQSIGSANGPDKRDV
jgi:hypothetical protein